MPPKPASRRQKMHPGWFCLFALTVGGLGLGYCEIMYKNGVDPIKDGGLIAIVAGLVATWNKLTA